MKKARDKDENALKRNKERQELQDRIISDRLAHIGAKFLVMSGKGGVGKSSVAAYLAVLLAKRGFHVGLMDVDLHGPSIPRILGFKGALQPSEHRTVRPIELLPNLEVMSIEYLLQDRDGATIWRGPLKIHVIRQFISDVEWGELDYLIFDSPPGTGDEPLTVAQTVPEARAILVTTPQEISLADVRKSISFCRSVNLKIAGIVENMNGLVCPQCGASIDLFKLGGGQTMAMKAGLRFLGALPIEPRIVKESDRGIIRILDDEKNEFTKKFNRVVDALVDLTASDLKNRAKTKHPPAILKRNGRTENTRSMDWDLQP